MTDRQLQGAKVLIVEDEYLIADDLARMLSQAGAILVGPVGTVSRRRDSWRTAAPTPRSSTSICAGIWHSASPRSCLRACRA